MFDSAKFLTDKFTSPDGVVGLCSVYRLKCPPRDTVRKWFERGVVPANWLPLLIVILELDGGEPVRLAEYITEEARS